jgi:hypothetical protein
MALEPDPLPVNDKIVTKDGYLSEPWEQWFQGNVIDEIAATPTGISTQFIGAQTGSIGTTSFPVPTLTQGLYMLGFIMYVTTPDSASSSVTLTINFKTPDGNPKTTTTTAMTGNTTATFSQGTLWMSCQTASVISYSTTVVVGGVGFSYALDMTLQRVTA